MKAIAARAIPIPEGLDIYFLKEEYPARDDITALEAVMESNDEVQQLEAKAEALNDAIASADEEGQARIQQSLEGIYSRLDQLDANSAEARATQILFGLGFTQAMQHQPNDSIRRWEASRGAFQMSGETPLSALR